MQKLESYRKGYVRIRFWGESPERFLNLCAYQKIPVWNLVSRDNAYEMNMTVEGFRNLPEVSCENKNHRKVWTALLFLQK